MQKNRSSLLFILLFTILTLSACASGHHPPYGGDLQAQRNLSDYEQRLRLAASASRNLFLTDIGRITYPGFEAPLWQISTRPQEDRVTLYLEPAPLLRLLLAKRSSPSSRRGCGYVGNWALSSYPHIHQPFTARVTFSLNTSG